MNSVERACAQQRAKYAANPQVYLARNTAYRRRNPELTILRRVRQRAALDGLEFNLTIEDIQIPTHCPALGIPLVVGEGRQHDASPSVDRLDPSKGYVKGNITVISFLANRIKSNATPAQVAAVAAWMAHGIT